MKTNREEFQKLIIEALENLPEQFKDKLQNVGIVVEEDVPRGFTNRKTVLLGLYRGIPLKKRDSWYSAALPDKITIYKNTIEEMCDSEAEIKKRVADVLYHEIGHHFGLSEEELK